MESFCVLSLYFKVMTGASSDVTQLPFIPSAASMGAVHDAPVRLSQTHNVEYCRSGCLATLDFGFQGNPHT